MRSAILESALRGKGRKLNHVEDFLTFYGSKGGWEIHDVFSNLGGCTFTLKWDGRVAVHFGRDSDGNFIMGTKAMWDRMKAPTSAGQIHMLFMANDKGEPWRPQLAVTLATVFELARESTPDDFRGFIMGDLLYSPEDPMRRDGEWIQFKPNRVTYSIKDGSAAGQVLRGTTAGIAMHTYHKQWGNDASSHANDELARKLDGGQVAFIPPVSSKKKPSVSKDNLDDLSRILKRHAHDFNWLIQERKGLKDLTSVIYRYTNYLAKTKTYDRISTDDFFEWVVSDSKLPKSKANRIGSLHQENEKALNALFPTLKGISQIKDDIIRQLDEAPDGVHEMTGNEKGGEGYVELRRGMKFVPRRRWVPEDWRRNSA